MSEQVTDKQAPSALKVVFSDPETGEVFGEALARPKAFSTGSIGFFMSGKLENPKNPIARYQASGNIVLIGSKPKESK